MIDLNTIPSPKILENISYEETLNANINIFKKYLNDDEILLLESDNYKALLETLSYRELLLRSRINAAISATLLPTASGSDLDNVVAIYGIERLKGVKPKAKIEFSLSLVSSKDTIIPKDAILSSSSANIALLCEDVVIKANELKAIGEILLDEYTKTSDVKCEYIQTPLPFVLKAKQLDSFSGGANSEDDDSLRKRAVLSLHRFSTAGASKAYEYHALSANAKIKEVSVLNGGPGIVEIYLKNIDEEQDAINDVKNALNDEFTRPLTDSINVQNATKKSIQIKADVELIDLIMQESIDVSIKSALNKDYKIGEDLNISFIYRCLHQNGVYRANLIEPVADIKVDDTSFVDISSIELTYKKAEL